MKQPCKSNRRYGSLHMRRFSVLTHRLRCCIAGYCKRAVDVSFSVSWYGRCHLWTWKDRM